MTSTAATRISHDQQPGRSDMDEHQRDEHLRIAYRAADQESRPVDEAAHRPSPEDPAAACDRARDAALAALTEAGLDRDEALALAECCAALKMPMKAAFTMPMENRTIRAALWARCRARSARCREDLDHRPSRQAAARPPRPGTGSWCCSLAPAGSPRNPDGLITRIRHRADADAAIRPPSRWSPRPWGDHRHSAAADQAALQTFPSAR
jgi:hypothetical protein